MNGIGEHEVIIGTADHARDLVDLSEQELRDVLWAFRERMLDLMRDARFKYILVFKNQGEAAGASLEHAHSQLIATPIIPKRVTEELDGAKAYFQFKERCIFCDIIRQEMLEYERVVRDYDSFISFEPFGAFRFSASSLYSAVLNIRANFWHNPSPKLPLSCAQIVCFI